MKVLSSNAGKKKIKGSPGKRSTSGVGFNEDDKSKIMNGKEVVYALLINVELKDHVDQRIEQAMEEITDRHHKEIDFLYKVRTTFLPSADQYRKSEFCAVSLT